MLAPTALRLRTKWTPSAEDYCLHAGAVFLSGAAGLLYSMSDNLYYLAAGAEYQTVTNPGHVDWIEAEVAVGDVTKRSEAFSILAWTSVFAVRCSLLAVSKKRCNANEHWLRQYYRGAMVVAVLSWLVCIITSPFLVCPLIVRTPSKDIIRGTFPVWTPR